MRALDLERPWRLSAPEIHTAMITKDQQQAMDLYAAPVEEMKIEAVEFATTGLLKFHCVYI
jgi:hypothetical protein